MSSRDESVELRLIGFILMEPEKAVPECVTEGVTDDYFVDDVLACVYSAASGLWARDGSVGDMMVVVDEANRIAKTAIKSSRFHELVISQDLMIKAMDYSTAVRSAVPLCRILRTSWMVRRLNAKLAHVNDDIAEFGVENAVSKLSDDVLKLVTSTFTEQNELATSSADALAKFEEAHQIVMVDRRSDYVPGLPCPWWQLTKTMNGIQPGLHIIGARPSVGKTAYVLQLCRYWVDHGYHVAFNSLDMAMGPLTMRMQSERARVSLGKAQFGYTSNEDISALRKATEELTNLPFHLTAERDVHRFATWCRIMKDAGKLHVAVIDFIQLMTYEGMGRDTDVAQMTRIADEVKALSVSLDIPIIALSQLSRKCEDDGGRVPKASDLRGSGALEQNAFTVTILHRDTNICEKWKTEPPMDVAGSAHMIQSISPIWAMIAKNQNGRTGNIPFVAYQAYFAWMLGDYAAECPMETVGQGALAKQRQNVLPMFSRVHADWRHASIEDDIARNRALLPEDLPPPPPPPQRVEQMTLESVRDSSASSSASSLPSSSQASRSSQSSSQADSSQFASEDDFGDMDDDDDDITLFDSPGGGSLV